MILASVYNRRRYRQCTLNTNASIYQHIIDMSATSISNENKRLINTWIHLGCEAFLAQSIVLWPHHIGHELRWGTRFVPRATWFIWLTRSNDRRPEVSVTNPPILHTDYTECLDTANSMLTLNNCRVMHKRRLNDNMPRASKYSNKIWKNQN